MTTSNITTYQLDRDDIITAALRKLGVLAIGQAPTSNDLSDGAMALNMLIAQFRTMGMPLWARKTYTFTPEANKNTYEIGIGKSLNTAYPLHILQAYRVDSGSTTKINVEVIPNYNYNLYPSTSGGPPIQLTYQPFVNYGEIKVWPTPDTSSTGSTVTIVYQAPFEYFNSATDTMAFPEEWYMPMVYNLAVALAPEWGLPLADRSQLMKEAMVYLEQTKSMGYEDGSFKIQPKKIGR